MVRTRMYATAALVSLSVCSTARAQAGSPTQLACIPLVAGATGLAYVGPAIPSSGQLAGRPGGFGAVTTVALPDAVVFKTSTQTFGAAYAFVLRDGVIFVRRAALGRGIAGEPWHVLDLPNCLKGHVTAISADEGLLLALGDGRQVYSHDTSSGDLSPERWTWRWGPYLWTGAGVRLWPDARSLATSSFGSPDLYTDPSGHERAPLGVATAYVLRGGGRRITYLDPWLPADDSREVCGPRRGTVALAALSASGSTVLAVSRAGEVFTRVYDFDVSGANTVFGDYSWQPGRPGSDTRWQLPGPVWVRHARPPGRFTDRLTILRTGIHGSDRLLRFAGRDRRGHAGYWEKPIAAKAWRFVRAAGVIGGRWLPRRGNSSDFAPDDRRYAGSINGSPAEVTDFNPECSPSHLRVTVAPGVKLDMLLHSSDGLRQETRARGLDDTPREYNGAIEVPVQNYAALRQGDPRRAWIDAHLGGARITVAPIAVTRTGLRFLRQCWELTLGGGPARPDVPRVPPDLGATVGRTTEQLKDGWGPVTC